MYIRGMRTVLAVWLHLCVVQWLLFIAFCETNDGVFPAPDNGNFGYCASLDCIKDSMEAVGAKFAHSDTEVVYVGIMSYNFQLDPYLAIYMGLLGKWLQFEETCFVILALEAPEGMTLGEAAIALLQTLPERSIYVALHHIEIFAFNVLDNTMESGATDDNQTSAYNTPPYNGWSRIVWHLNDEQPWCRPSSPNEAVPAVDEPHGPLRLQDIYKKFPLVIRNYYYAPLLMNSTFQNTYDSNHQQQNHHKHSKNVEASSFLEPGGDEPLVHYLPVHVPYYGFVLGNHSNEWIQQGLHRTKASQRRQWCHFRGRIDYNIYGSDRTSTSDGTPSITTAMHTSKEAFVFDPILHKDDATIVLESDEFLPQAMERRYLKALADQGQLPRCNISATDVSSKKMRKRDVFERTNLKQNYLDMIHQMMQTVFVLCPTGNNPETFRHYEALECGAIPVFLRPKAYPAAGNASSGSFLDSSLWMDYPGPILNNWLEITSLIDTITPAEADTLQERVQDWYRRGMEREKQLLYQKIMRALGPLPLPAADKLSGSINSVDTAAGYETTGVVDVMSNLEEILRLQEELLLMEQQEPINTGTTGDISSTSSSSGGGSSSSGSSKGDTSWEHELDNKNIYRKKKKKKSVEKTSDTKRSDKIQDKSRRHNIERLNDYLRDDSKLSSSSHDKIHSKANKQQNRNDDDGDKQKSRPSALSRLKEVHERMKSSQQASYEMSRERDE